MGEVNTGKVEGALRDSESQHCARRRECRKCQICCLWGGWCLYLWRNVLIEDSFFSSNLNTMVCFKRLKILHSMFPGKTVLSTRNYYKLFFLLNYLLKPAGMLMSVSFRSDLCLRALDFSPTFSLRCWPVMIVLSWSLLQCCLEGLISPV